MNLFFVIVPPIILAVVLLFVFAAKKAKGDVQEYDERQLIARGNGYKYGFFTALIYMILIIYLTETRLIKNVSTTFLICLGIFFSLLVFECYCIVKDAFLSLTQNRKSYIILCAIIVVVDAINVILATLDGIDFENGSIDVSLLANGLLGLLFGIMLILLIIKGIIAKRDAE